MPKTKTMRFQTVTCLVASFAFGCQSPQTAQRPDSNPARHSPSEIASPGSSAVAQDSLTEDYTLQKEIRKASADLRIDNLIDRPSGTEHEIRIWVGFGLSYPRCFILRQTNGTLEASHVTVTTVSGPTGNATTVRTILGTPKSGWDRFERFLRSQGIGSSIHLAPEHDYIPNPDGQIIALESKSGAGYSMVFFHLDNKSAEAQKAVSVCRRVEEEFGITMHCSSQ